MKARSARLFAVLAVFGGFLALISIIDDGRLSVFAPLLFAHCDTLGGPVIKAAKKALESGDVRPVLIWVQKQDEATIQKAFQKTLAVRKLNAEAQELADMYFFETLVRIHRAGEGAPFTGLKPAGAEEPPIAAADKAVESGRVDELAGEISAHVSAGIKKHFHDLMEKKKTMMKSVEAGREFVAAYVTFIHYVEKLYLDAAGSAEHGTAAHQ